MIDIVLPVGISFYTFHTITYIVDGYRGSIKPTRNLFEFAAYVSLFSQLVAGPIVRFRQIEAGSRTDRRPRRTPVARAGLLLLRHRAGREGARRRQPRRTSSIRRSRTAAALGMAGAWLASLGYTFQLYFDFSGYSEHGGRARPAVRPAHPDELQLTVQGAESSGLLAALAHLAVDLPARLPLHPAGRQSRRRVATRIAT